MSVYRSVDLVWLDRLAFQSWLLSFPGGKVIGSVSSSSPGPGLLACYMREVTGCYCQVSSAWCGIHSREGTGVRLEQLPVWALQFVKAVDLLAARSTVVTREQALAVLASIPGSEG